MSTRIPGDVGDRLRGMAEARISLWSIEGPNNQCNALSEGRHHEDGTRVRCLLLANDYGHLPQDWVNQHLLSMYRPGMSDVDLPVLHLGVEGWWLDDDDPTVRWPVFQLFIVEDRPQVPFGGVNGTMRAPRSPQPIEAGEPR